MVSAKTTKFALLDTAVYIENFRSGRFTFRLLQSPFVFAVPQLSSTNCFAGLEQPLNGSLSLN